MAIKRSASCGPVLTGAFALLVTTISAQAFESMKMGDWDITISGNINGFLTSIDCDPKGNTQAISGGLACGSFGIDRDVGNIQTGLLPSWFGLNAVQEGSTLTTEINIGFQPGIDGGNQGAITGAQLDGGLGLNSENLRQVNLKFGSDWGMITIGRDLGIFGSDAILSDMTLLGTGTVSDLAAGGGNTTLGRIGVGYIYADWKGQIQYASPSWDGFSFNVAIVDPWGLVNLYGDGLSLNAASFSQEGNTYGFEGKVGYTWGDDESTTSGKVWASFIRQALDTSSTAFSDQDATGFDVGGKVSFSGLELVGYYYSGDGIGTTDVLFDAMDPSGATRDSDGFYVQGTYTVPGSGTKLGVSFGESNLDLGPGDPVASASSLIETNESFVIGVYHPVTQSLNLVIEYTNTEATAHNGNTAEEGTFAIGGILFY